MQFFTDEISNILPQPDLKQMEEKLNQQKKCIFKSLPVSRLASKTDSPAYNKASPHLTTFKVIEYFLVYLHYIFSLVYVR